MSLRLDDYGLNLTALAVALQGRRKRKSSPERINDLLIDVREWSQLDVPAIVQRLKDEPLALLAVWEVTEAQEYLETYAIAEAAFLKSFQDPQLLRHVLWLDLAEAPESMPELPLTSVLSPPAPWAGLLYLQLILRWAERFAHYQRPDPRELARLNLSYPILKVVSDGKGGQQAQLIRDLLAGLGVQIISCRSGMGETALEPWLSKQLQLRTGKSSDAQRRLTFIEAGGPGRSLFVVRAIGGVDGWEVRGQIGDDLALIIDIGDREVTAAATAYMEGHVMRIINSQTPITADLVGDSLRLRWFDTSLTAEDMGRLIHEALKREFTLRIISVNLIFDSMRINSLKPSILSYREERNRQLAKRSEETSAFIACRACQCYAPHAFCVVSVDRPPCCGRSYDELSTLAQFTTHMEQFEIEPGVCRDRQRGSYMGVDKAARFLSEDAVLSLNLHSLRDLPHPTTAIPQCIAYYLDELDLICILSADYSGRAPDGKTFETLLTRTAGRQQPGYAGISEAYIASPRFFAQEGGLARVGWMNSSLKQRLKLKIEHIATELECTNMNALREFIAQGRG